MADTSPFIVKGGWFPSRTGMAHNTLLHSFLRCEMVLFSRETVVCIFYGIFPGCELVSTIVE